MESSLESQWDFQHSYVYNIGCLVYLCDFHREQAWERWVRTTAHGVSQERDAVLSQLRRIAHASSEEVYKDAVTGLQDSSVWKDNQHFQHWFQKTWLSQSKVILFFLMSASDGWRWELGRYCPWQIQSSAIGPRSIIVNCAVWVMLFIIMLKVTVV